MQDHAEQRTEEERHIVLFTDSYPYGSGEHFLETEIDYLSACGVPILIVPLRHGGRQQARPVPDHVSVQSPLLARDGRTFLAVKGLLNGSALFSMVREGFRAKAYRSPQRWRKWIEAMLTVRHLLRHRGFADIFGNPSRYPVLYFYWGSGTAWALPFLNPSATAVVRFHGYDLYEERRENAGYIPFRKYLLQHLDHAVFVTEHGREYLTNRYSDIDFDARVFRLGAKAGGRSRPSEDGVLRIVTCSRMAAVKRIDLLIEALKLIDFTVKWIHIGDGPLRKRLGSLARELPTNVSHDFVGHLSNAGVLKFYAGSNVDLFINVSEFEGAPVSIMEALAAGIPVFAADVGGTSELIDEHVGKLLPSSITVDRLADAIRKFSRREGARQGMRERAHARWKERADAETNYQEFAGFLAGLVADGTVARSGTH